MKQITIKDLKNSFIELPYMELLIQHCNFFINKGFVVSNASAVTDDSLVFELNDVLYKGHLTVTVMVERDHAVWNLQVRSTYASTVYEFFHYMRHSAHDFERLWVEAIGKSWKEVESQIYGTLERITNPDTIDFSVRNIPGTVYTFSEEEIGKFLQDYIENASPSAIATLLYLVDGNPCIFDDGKYHINFGKNISTTSIVHHGGVDAVFLARKALQNNMGWSDMLSEAFWRGNDSEAAEECWADFIERGYIGDSDDLPNWSQFLYNEELLSITQIVDLDLPRPKPWIYKVFKIDDQFDVDRENLTKYENVLFHAIDISRLKQLEVLQSMNFEPSDDERFSVIRIQ